MIAVQRPITVGLGTPPRENAKPQQRDAPSPDEQRGRQRSRGKESQRGGTDVKPQWHPCTNYGTYIAPVVDSEPVHAHDNKLHDEHQLEQHQLRALPDTPVGAAAARIHRQLLGRGTGLHWDQPATHAGSTLGENTGRGAAMLPSWAIPRVSVPYGEVRGKQGECKVRARNSRAPVCQVHERMAPCAPTSVVPHISGVPDCIGQAETAGYIQLRGCSTAPLPDTTM